MLCASLIYILATKAIPTAALNSFDWGDTTLLFERKINKVVR